MKNNWRNGELTAVRMQAVLPTLASKDINEPSFTSHVVKNMIDFRQFKKPVSIRTEKMPLSKNLISQWIDRRIFRFALSLA